MSTSGLLVVVGSGPGIGSATASLFASNGFNIALMSRSAERLKEDQARVSKANSKIECNVFPADVADSSALKRALNQIHESMGPPEVVLFNTARIAPTTIGETDPSDSRSRLPAHEHWPNRHGIPGLFLSSLKSLKRSGITPNISQQQQWCW